LSSTNTYITASSVTSNATFYALSFNNNRIAGTNRYSVIASTEANLSWFMSGWAGARGGASSDWEDSGLDKVTWGTAPGANTCQLITSVRSSVWSDPGAWDQGIVPSTCNAVTIAANTTVTIDTTTAVASTTTINGTLAFSRTVSSTF